jgi:uncharacterized protein (DUF2461 family)
VKSTTSQAVGKVAKNKSRYHELVVEPALLFINSFAPHLYKLSPFFLADARPTRGSLFRMPRSRADGGNWRGRGIRLSSSRTWVPTNLWRSWLMEKSQCMGLGIGRENNETN